MIGSIEQERTNEARITFRPSAPAVIDVSRGEKSQLSRSVDVCQSVFDMEPRPADVEYSYTTERRYSEVVVPVNSLGCTCYCKPSAAASHRDGAIALATSAVMALA
jgi:hypothetical protein